MSLKNCHYVYLNIYESNGNTYYYVGQHGWDGEGIDNNYNCSSTFVKSLGWLPSSTIILEDVTEKPIHQILLIERKWIDNYVIKYGIVPFHNTVNNKYVNKYVRDDGKCLNLNNNTNESALISSIQSESVSKRVNTQINRYKGLPCNTKESSLKEVETKRNGGLYKNMKWASKESRNKAADTRKKKDYYNNLICSTTDTAIDSYKISSRLGALTKQLNNIRPVYRKVNVVDTDIVGSVLFCCKKLNHPEWACRVCAKFRKGLTEVEHHNFKFKVL